MTSRFDEEATAWDSNRFTVASSKLAFGSLLENLAHVPELRKYRGWDGEGDNGLAALEIGCGTGLLSLLVAPYLAHLTAVDASSSMIKALESKLAIHSPTGGNIRPVCATLEEPNDPRLQDTNSPGTSPKRFDLVISHLVLHHIPSLSAMMKLMYGVLKPGGLIALTDFENFGPEARKFHPESKLDEVERHGIGKGEMESLIKDAGFVEVTVKEAFSMEKDVELDDVGPLGEKGQMVFPFLICLGRKQGGDEKGNETAGGDSAGAGWAPPVREL